MRSLLAVCLLFISISAYSETIKCFSGSQTIYMGHGTDISYEDNLLAFKEEKTDKYVIIAGGNCIVIFT